MKPYLLFCTIVCSCWLVPAMLVLGACQEVDAPARLLYVWMGDVDRDPVGLTGSLPHHTEYVMPNPGQPLFANAHMSERVLRFDLADPLNPRAHAL